MPRRIEWLGAIREIENEYFAMELGSEYLRDAVNTDPTIVLKDDRAKFLSVARDNLQATYFVRLYAVFENGLRDFWITHIRKSEPQMKQLLDAVASRCKVPYEALDNAHAVRKCRNSIVHYNSKDTSSVGIQDARSHLCIYFSRLPFDW
ncbi:hypothetical protein [uncultured Rubinisphaera sp.]|uniref:hypothetical protein n=1 Tax=uncultured Rubinisphaera sp. TaxID=1678686 RepID=UPI0030DCD5E1|tara:strand:+ start:160 stop:606 length:447 start_codon:yes stop_codon:yes gene_type:complete